MFTRRVRGQWDPGHSILKSRITRPSHCTWGWGVSDRVALEHEASGCSDQLHPGEGDLMSVRVREGGACLAAA